MGEREGKQKDQLEGGTDQGVVGGDGEHLMGLECYRKQINGTWMAWALGERGRKIKNELWILDVRKSVDGGSFTETDLLGWGWTKLLERKTRILLGPC